MATSIERKQPTNGRALAVFDKPGNVTPYLDVAKQIRDADLHATWFAHSQSMVPFATQQRDRWLPLFARANAAYLALDKINHRGVVDRSVAIDMLTALLGAFGAKKRPRHHVRHAGHVGERHDWGGERNVAAGVCISGGARIGLSPVDSDGNSSAASG